MVKYIAITVSVVRLYTYLVVTVEVHISTSSKFEVPSETLNTDTPATI